jgi:shikimate kinase
MKLIFISGQGGAGKSSVGKALVKEINHSVYIGADSLVTTNPWEFGKKTDELAIKNAICLIDNFLASEFENIIIGGLARNQEVLDKFLLAFNRETEMLFVWLRADKKIRISRKEKRNRDLSDSENNFNFVDNLMPDIKAINIENGKSIFIDTSSKTVEEVIKEIKLEL